MTQLKKKIKENLNFFPYRQYLGREILFVSSSLSYFPLPISLCLSDLLILYNSKCVILLLRFIHFYYENEELPNLCYNSNVARDTCKMRKDELGRKGSLTHTRGGKCIYLFSLKK